MYMSDGIDNWFVANLWFATSDQYTYVFSYVCV